jgi:hypothetical protein
MIQQSTKSEKEEPSARIMNNEYEGAKDLKFRIVLMKNNNKIRSYVCNDFVHEGKEIAMKFKTPKGDKWYHISTEKVGRIYSNDKLIGKGDL